MTGNLAPGRMGTLVRILAPLKKCRRCGVDPVFEEDREVHAKVPARVNY